MVLSTTAAQPAVPADSSLLQQKVGNGCLNRVHRKTDGNIVLEILGPKDEFVARINGKHLGYRGNDDVCLSIYGDELVRELLRIKNGETGLLEISRKEAGPNSLAEKVSIDGEGYCWIGIVTPEGDVAAQINGKPFGLRNRVRTIFLMEQLALDLDDLRNTGESEMLNKAVYGYR